MMNEQQRLELSVTRYIDASPQAVWSVMTGRLPEWWCPLPWRAELNAVDWHAGGRFETSMYGPEGEQITNRGLFLEVVPNQRLVFTDAINGEFEPQQPFMIGIMEINAEADGTRYTASARHWSREAMQQHEQMGFTEGWSAVAAQLAALAEAR